MIFDYLCKVKLVVSGGIGGCIRLRCSQGARTQAATTLCLRSDRKGAARRKIWAAPLRPSLALDSRTKKNYTFRLWLQGRAPSRFRQASASRGAPTPWPAATFAAPRVHTAFTPRVGMAIRAACKHAARIGHATARQVAPLAPPFPHPPPWGGVVVRGLKEIPPGGDGRP